jgi:hypothetical protein
MASFDHFGTEARFSFFASCWQHTDNKLNAVVRNSTVLIDLFIIIRLNIAYFNPPLAPPGRGIIFNFLLSPYIDLVSPWIKCKIYTYWKGCLFTGEIFRVFSFETFKIRLE